MELLHFKKWILSLVGFTLCFPAYLNSQFSDSFSDGNLQGWFGDTLDFKINAEGILQLDAPADSSGSFIYAPLAFADSMTWEYYFRLEFAPSASNQLIVHLGLVDSDPLVSPGYSLEVGATGDMDPILFKYFDGSTMTIVEQSEPGIVAQDPVELNLYVIAKNGYWKFYNRSTGKNELLFTAFHDQLALSQLRYFGIQCRYSSTRRDKFYFDDILVESFKPDTVPPDIVSLDIKNDRSVILGLNELPDSSASSITSNYVLQPGALHASTIQVTGDSIEVAWEQPFISLVPYSLHVKMLQDTSGNILPEKKLDFSYIRTDKASQDEILITEIMADPSPPIGLPPSEYIEVYNNSGKVFNLSDYTVRIGSNEKPLQDSLLFPGEYILLTGSDQATSFAWCRTMGITNMPALTNSGSSVEIINSDGHVIHEISYTSDWYQDDQKNDGGWSLEMINPLLLCSGMDNWSASIDLAGGTPGEENSQWILRPDTSGPSLLSLFPVSPYIIELRFDEKVEPDRMLESNRFHFSPERMITTLELVYPNSIQIQFSQMMEEGSTYTLLPFEALDCLGNPRQVPDSTLFGVVAAPQPGDVLINEVLFNPVSGGSRFVEIINASQKFINLGDLSVGRINSNTVQIYPIEYQEILPPGGIAAISPERTDILFRYTVPYPDRLYEGSLPSWDDKKDNVSIVSTGVVIDSFTYSSDWHHPVISDREGVSLERVSIFFSGADENIWHSAASLYGFATPTGPNSQTAIPAGSQAPFRLTNRIFSPNEDGFKDFLLVDFEPGPGNSVASLWVYDLEGREIRQLLSNETLGDSPVIKWDGRNSEGKLADMGIYLLLARFWDETGRVHKYQETCSLIKR